MGCLFQAHSVLKGAGKTVLLVYERVTKSPVNRKRWRLELSISKGHGQILADMTVGNEPGLLKFYCFGLPLRFKKRLQLYSRYKKR